MTTDISFPSASVCRRIGSKWLKAEKSGAKRESGFRAILLPLSSYLSCTPGTDTPLKTKVVNFRGESEKKYPRKLDFLGFTIKLQMVRTKAGLKLMTTNVMSHKSMSSVLEKFRAKKIHKIRTEIRFVSVKFSPIIKGIMNYYCLEWSYIWSMEAAK